MLLKGKTGQLARVLASRRQLGAFLALPPSLVPVRVLRRHFVAPFTVRLAGVLRRERLAATAVLGVADGLPVCRILTGSMLARVAANTRQIAVVAHMIHDLAWFEWADEFPEAVSVGRHRALLAIGVLAVVLLASVTCPRPAVIRAALINEGEVPLKSGHVPAERAAEHARLPQLAVVTLAQPLGPRWLAALAARPPHALMAWLKRISVGHQLAVVGRAESSAIRRLLTVLAIRHSTIVAPVCVRIVV